MRKYRDPEREREKQELEDATIADYPRTGYGMWEYYDDQWRLEWELEAEDEDDGSDDDSSGWRGPGAAPSSPPFSGFATGQLTPWTSRHVHTCTNITCCRVVATASIPAPHHLHHDAHAGAGPPDLAPGVVQGQRQREREARRAA